MQSCIDTITDYEMKTKKKSRDDTYGYSAGNLLITTCGFDPSICLPDFDRPARLLLSQTINDRDSTRSMHSVGNFRNGFQYFY